MLKSLFIFVLLLATASCRHESPQASDQIDYRGQKIKLSKAYSDYDDYKDDPDNIHPTETARVQRLVIDAPIAKRFESLDSLTKSAQEIEFPGYGLTLLGQQSQTDGSGLTGFCIEIPRAQKERCLAFREVSGVYELIDDFVADEDSMIANVKEQNGSLVYSSVDGSPVVTRPLNK